MKTLAEIKSKQIAILRSDIEELASQNEREGKAILHIKVHGMLLMMMSSGIITEQEFAQLGDEVAAANAKAAALVNQPHK
jgi:hypothetical protein